MSVASRIYEKLPVVGQNLAVSVYGLKLERLRYSGTHAATLRHLRETQWASQEGVSGVVRRKLSETLRSAVRDVPWYRDQSWNLPGEVGPDILDRLPVLMKEQVQQSPDSFVSDRYRSTRLHSVFTGGTTGRPLRVRASAETLRTNYAFFMRFKEWTGVSGKVRSATFAGRTVVPADSGSPYWRVNLARNTWLFSSYHLAPSTMAHYVDGLTSVDPELIDAYPSSLEPIARFIIEHGIQSVRPKAVITSSETLLPEARRVIQKAFQCPVFDHYGGAEMAALVTQCEEGRYHVNPEFGVVEILRDGVPVEPGETGEIVATGFINPAMPLIRYATGDLGSYAEEQHCSCGRNFPILNQPQGRMDDVVVTPDGRRIGRLDPIFKTASGLHEARIVQDRRDLLILEYVPAPWFEDSQLDPIIEALRERVGGTMMVKAEEKERLERTRGGKLRMVVNRMKDDEGD